MNGPVFRNHNGAPRREPVFNMPPAVAWTAFTLIAIYVVMTFLSQEMAQRMVIDFAFIPARFTGLPPEWAMVTPSGPEWATLTMITHAGLHGGIYHLAFNVLWLMAFGTPVARALGTIRFFILFLVCAVGGAAAFWLTHPDGLVPVVGASGAISGMMAAAIRFMLAAGPLSRGALTMSPWALVPLQSPRFLAFTAAWLGINLVFGLFGSAFSGSAIAWEAHMGGYFVGALAVGLLIRRKM